METRDAREKAMETQQRKKLEDQRLVENMEKLGRSSDDGRREAEGATEMERDMLRRGVELHHQTARRLNITPEEFTSDVHSVVTKTPSDDTREREDFEREKNAIPNTETEWKWEDGTGTKWVEDILNEIEKNLPQIEPEDHTGLLLNKWVKYEAKEAETAPESRMVVKEEVEPIEPLDSMLVIRGESELDKVKNQLENLSKISPELKGVEKAPVILLRRQKIFCFDNASNGKVLGNIFNYWRGSEGTDRPSTNIEKPGTYVLDTQTGKFYDAQSGEVVGEAAPGTDMSGNEMKIAELTLGKKYFGVFLPPIGRATHRRIAFRSAVQGHRYLVLRVPSEKDMMSHEKDADYKISEAITLAGERIGEGAQDMWNDIKKHPIETVLMMLTGRAGMYYFGADLTKRFSEAVAIARDAETKDEIEAAAQIIARGYAELGVVAATMAAKGAVGAGVRGFRAGRARAQTGVETIPAGEGARVSPTGEAETVPDAFADTLPGGVPFEKTVPATSGSPRVRGPSTRSPLENKLFDYYRDTYFNGDTAKAEQMLNGKAYEGDISHAIKSQEFRRRLEPELERRGNMPAERLRRLAEDVDQWYQTEFELEPKDIIEVFDTSKPGEFKFGRWHGWNSRHTKAFMSKMGHQAKYYEISSLATELQRDVAFNNYLKELMVELEKRPDTIIYRANYQTRSGLDPAQYIMEFRMPGFNKGEPARGLITFGAEGADKGQILNAFIVDPGVQVQKIIVDGNTVPKTIDPRQTYVNRVFVKGSESTWRSSRALE